MFRDFSTFVETNAKVLELEDLKQQYLSGDKSILVTINKKINQIQLTKELYEYLKNEYLPTLTSNIQAHCDKDFMYNDIKTFDLKTKFLGSGVKDFNKSIYLYQIFKTYTANIYDIEIYNKNNRHTMFGVNLYEKLVNIKRVALNLSEKQLLINYLDDVLYYLNEDEALYRINAQKYLTKLGNTMSKKIVSNLVFKI